MMDNPTAITLQHDEPSALMLAGQAANRAAGRHVFVDYQSRRAANTLRRQRADLALFAQALMEIQQDVENAEPVGDLQHDPGAWRGITWGLVAAFVRWQLRQGYAVGSINVRLSTVKKYATLAFRAGAIDANEFALIRTVEGYQHKEKKHVDEQRAAEGVENRIDRPGAKKAEAVSIPPTVVKMLKLAAADTPQGRRDALLMCLLLDHGLRCGEVARLKVGHFNLSVGTLTFYRPKVDKVQTHQLTRDTLKALKAWIKAGDCPLAADAPILRGSRRGGQLTHSGMSERAITKRVAELGAVAGLDRLSAHDCRHSWATRASRKGTDPFSLQEAGGWNSLAMPRRYVEAARIANEGVKLED